MDMTAFANAAAPPTTPGKGSPRRVVLFNVKFSPNLGDGLLSECLERELARSLPEYEVVSVDLAGRTGYSAGSGESRGRALKLLERLPLRIRQLCAGFALRALLALKLRRHYRAGLAGAEGVVVGGGNLLSDADLNFPLKLSGALAAAKRGRLPVAVYGVGVSPHWSAAGTRLFGDAFRTCRLVSAAVRDPQSQHRWQATFAQCAVPDADVVVDPGMLASAYYPRGAQGSSRQPVGFCITDPVAVRYHGGSAETQLDDWYPAAFRALVRHGYEVVLFTNGSPEDREYLYRNLDAWVHYANGPVSIGPSFTEPADLAAFVSGCRAVVAHRMHACIAAHSFGVPAVGLRWDVKLDSFFDLAGRGAHIVDPAETSADTLGERVAAAIADVPDPSALIAQAQAEVAVLAAGLQQVMEHAA